MVTQGHDIYQDYWWLFPFSAVLTHTIKICMEKSETFSLTKLVKIYVEFLNLNNILKKVEGIIQQLLLCPKV